MPIDEDFNEKSLLALNQKGWFLAPKETTTSFLLRKKAFFQSPLLTDEDLCQKTTSLLYDFRLQKVPISYSKKSLFPWQGAVLWAYQTLDKIEFPVIQLNPNIFSHFFGRYTKQEVLSHELIHTVRFAFKEPLFEEIFAYKTSPGFFRRFFGPLFLYPIEPTLLVLSSIACSILSWFESLSIGLWISISLFCIFLLRLFILQWIFYRCQKRLKQIGASSPSRLPIMIRLSDREILKTAFRAPEKTKKYFIDQSKTDLRLKVILQTYLPFIH